MYNENSIWSKRDVENRVPDDFPFDIAKGLAKEHELFLSRVTSSSRMDALQVWCAAVSGVCPGDDEASKKAGLDGQPYWDYKAYDTFGFFDTQGEDVTNFHDAYTGYMLFMDNLTSIGISEQVADLISRYVMYRLSGDYQRLNDIKGLRFHVDHTWWGEEVKDVSRLKLGMDYGQFMRMSRSVEKMGIYLNEKDFGFKEYERKPRESAFGVDLPWKEYEKFQSENEEALKRWERERHQADIDEEY